MRQEAGFDGEQLGADETFDRILKGGLHDLDHRHSGAKAQAREEVPVGDREAGAAQHAHRDVESHRVESHEAIIALLRLYFNKRPPPDCYNAAVTDPFSRLEAARELCAVGRPDRALALLKPVVPATLAAERLLLQGEALRGQGYFGRASAAYKAALKRLARDDRDLVFDAWLGLARCSRSLGATAAARRALNGARRVPGADRETLALEDALVLRAESAHRPALKAMLPMLASARRRRDWPAVGFLLWAVAGSRRFSGDLAGSHRDFKESLSAFKRGRDAEGEAYALFGLGGIARVRGFFPEARRAYVEAGKRLRSGPDLFGRAYAHCGLANCLRQMGLLAEAEKNYRLSYSLYAGLDDRVDLAFVDWGLGQIHQRRGELPAAERRYRAALAAFSGGGEDRGLVLARKSLAEVLHARGRTAEAEKLFDSAVALARRAGLTAHLESYT